MTIKEVSEKFGLTQDTLRYYEKIGLLDNVERDEQGNRNYQEKERATYNVNGVEVDIDSWPLIPTYVEIENDSEEVIFDTVRKLGLEQHEIVSCNTANVYNKYGIDLYKFRELRFAQKENEKERE